MSIIVILHNQLLRQVQFRFVGLCRIIKKKYSVYLLAREQVGASGVGSIDLSSIYAFRSVVISFIQRHDNSKHIRSDCYDRLAAILVVTLYKTKWLISMRMLLVVC